MTNILHVELAIDFLANEHILFSFAKNELVNKLLSAIYGRSTLPTRDEGFTQVTYVLTESRNIVVT
jgi:hypothetical protein